MRNDEDIIRISLSLVGDIEIDLERIETDPVWRSVKSTGASIPDCLSIYIQHYVAIEKLFRSMPCTNGPGTLTLIEIKETYNG